VLLLSKSDEGNYLVTPDTVNGGDVFMGQPLHVDYYGPACTAGLKVAVYGNFSQGFVVRFIGPLEISRSDEAGSSNFVSWESTFRFQIRVASGFLNPVALRCLALHA
jgi:HK97 family phage major capsid protein